MRSPALRLLPLLPPRRPTVPETLVVAGHTVEVVRKRVKHVRLSVGPPDGQVRVTAPPHVRLDVLRMAVVARLPWIERATARFAAQPRQSPRTYESGESHDFLGRRYRLNVAERAGRPTVAVRGTTYLDLTVRPGSTADDRRRVLDAWYRRELAARVPAIVAAWEPVMGVSVAEWRLKRMRTLWGSCAIEARRIWLNVALVRASEACIEYVVVHEMVHLLERNHTPRFYALMTQFLPGWERLRADLNGGGLSSAEPDE